MRCSNCGTESTGVKKFCAECGSALALRCPKCAADNKPTSKFCEDCGTPLTGSAVPSSTSPQAASATSKIRVTPEQPDASPADGERKTVTALFADIKGSTELERDLDPEEARAIVDPVLQLMMAAVHRYDGYVAQSTGDGIFALFGAPVAHEDHAQRALYAALAMQQELRQHGERLKSQGRPSVEARIGVNTGEVVMRTIHTGGHPEYTPVGHVTNLAARMQTAAPTGGIAISEDTRRLVEGYFELRGLGPTPIKGVAEPVNVFTVVGVGPLRGHFELAARRGLTTFIGRERELSELRRTLEMAIGGHGQIAAVVAEAGTGKSRLFHEFKTTLPAKHKLLEAYSVSHGKASPWLPVLELLRSYFRFQEADDSPTRRKKIEGSLAALDTGLADTLPYLFALFGIIGDSDPLAGMDPPVKRRRTLDAIKRILLRESLDQLLVVIFEDLHWIDDYTQALLDLLVDSIAQARVLLLVNYRPEYHHSFGGRIYYTQIRLDPLGRESAQEMLSSMLGDEPALVALKQLILERTQGNPFFIEEIVQALFDEAVLVRNGTVKLARALSQLRLPLTVQGMLAARIDRLPPRHKDLLQTLAVVGKESPLRLLRTLTSSAESEAERILLALQTSEFIYEQPAANDVEYVFKHALTQEVAYNSLLIERRKQLHERVGAAIEALYSVQLSDHLGELARHYQRSGHVGKALEYLPRAAEQAVARSCHAEAASLFTSALELTKALPETAEREQKELDLQIALGSALFAAKGWSAPEAGKAAGRAADICRKAGSTSHLFIALCHLVGFNFTRGELSRAYEFAEEALEIAEDKQDARFLVWANCNRGLVSYAMGELISARAHLERAISLYDPAQQDSYRVVSPDLDPGPWSMGWAAWTLHLLGYADQALERIRQALALARELGTPFGVVHALWFSPALHAWRAEAQTALDSADELLRLTTDHGFEQMAHAARVNRAVALIELGRVEEGLVQLEGGFTAVQALGAVIFFPFYALGNAYDKVGRTVDGLAAVDAGLAMYERTGEKVYQAALYGLRGELLLKLGPKEDEAKLCFHRALEIARRQQAKLRELKTTMSLARLLAKQGRGAEACSMLGEIYNWFTEGFDTADLKDAKALLNELSI